MRNGSNELNTVDRVIQKLPVAREILREARIDSTNRLNLRQAALAASVEPDELLAKIERRARYAPRIAPKVVVEEFEYV
ncbi:MAG: hypothetical protein HC822_07985 [Oscillochloris sp.]|nr:hypothetical protein [Oscillochloris sp.]